MVLHNFFNPRLGTGSLLLASVLLSGNASAEQPHSLNETVKIAIERDPWLAQSEYQQQAEIELGFAADSLPNPEISISMANVPVDGFRFDQEPMTQLITGVKQRFPRGDAQDIMRSVYEQRALTHPIARALRKAQVRRDVTRQWLDVYQANIKVTLLESEQDLFKQVADIVTASYTSAVGRARQQDVLQAEIQLIRIEDQLIHLRSSKEVAQQRLIKWLLPSDTQRYEDFVSISIDMPNQFPLSFEYNAEPFLKSASGASVYELIKTHPALVLIDQKVTVSETEIKLAEQQFKPQFGVDARYGYRQDDPSGNSRADFFSVGVTFDLPIVNQRIQEHQVSARVLKSEAVKTEKLLKAREMIASVKSIYSDLSRLEQRKNLYETSILPQLQQQAEASLTAYTNDDGLFADAIQSKIELLEAQLMHIDITVKLYQQGAELAFYLSPLSKVNGE